MAPAVRPAVPVWRCCLRRAHHTARKRARLAPGFVFPASCHGWQPCSGCLQGSRPGPELSADEIYKRRDC